MRIKKIKIANYRGFRDCPEIHFHPNVNIFIGSNASGKTSLLRAILKSLHTITSAFSPINNPNKELNIRPEDANYNATSFSIVTWLNSFPQYQQEISTIISTNPDTEYNKKMVAHHDSRARFLNWLQREASIGPMTIPIVKFYAANRGSISYTEARYGQPLLQISQFETWANIYQDDISYSKFFKWFLENETNELLLQRDAQNFNVQSPSLRDVRVAINRAFDFLGYNKCKIKVKQIKRQGSSELLPVLALEDTITKKEELLDNKSDGEKAIIAMVADIAYNLSIAKDFVYNDNFLDSPGVVLIDEIETHLHPNWQRTIIPMLTSIFPNIQFFVTTHSPQIISSVPSNSVFALQNFTVRQILLKTLGEDSNMLLKYVFESTERPHDFMQLIEQFDSLIDRRARFSDLEQVINDVVEMEKRDSAQNLGNLISKLRLQLEAYKFDREHEENK